MVETAERRMTLAEFSLRAEGETGRWELVDDRQRTLPEPTSRQKAIAGNVAQLIDRLLHAGDARHVRRHAGVPIGRGAGLRLLVPDVTVTAEPALELPYVQAPLLIVEIEAASSVPPNKTWKIGDYAELPSIQELWLVKSGSPIFLAWQRRGTELQGLIPQLPGQSFQSQFLGGEVPVDDLYEEIDFIPPPANPEAG